MIHVHYKTRQRCSAKFTHTRIYICLYMCIISSLPHLDYPKLNQALHSITPPKQQQNTLIRTLAESVFSPAAFDFWASHIDRTWSWQRPLARIVAREVIAQDCVTLTLKPNRHVAPFIAGQHLNVSLEIKGIRLTRSYSPSRVKSDQKSGQPDCLTITIKRMAHGKVSHWLYDHAQVGDVLEIGAPFGEMTLTDAPQDYLLLAAGSGITPFISLIRAWAEQQTQSKAGNVTLLYWAKTEAELCFTQELRALAETSDQFQVHFLLTQEAVEANAPQGRINADLLSHLTPDLAGRIVYACGPADFVRSAEVLSAGQAQAFHGEAFSQPALIDATNSDAPPVQIRLTRSQRTVSVPVGQPLLAALEAQGIYPASGCRMGICNTCVCIKQAGTTEHIRDKEQNSEAGASIRICVSSARSDLSLDL